MCMHLRHRSGEQKGLARILRWKHCEHLCDGWAEAHFEQLICFVKDEILELRKLLLEAMILKQVVEPSRCRHKDIWHPLPHLAQIRFHIRSSIHNLEVQLMEFSELLTFSHDLTGQLSGWGDAKYANSLQRTSLGPDGELLDRGDQERESFTCACLGFNHHIVWAEGDWNGHCLDLCHGLVAQNLRQGSLGVVMQWQVNETRFGHLRQRGG